MDRPPSGVSSIDENPLEMIRVEGGTLMMSGPNSERSVMVPDYFIGKYEVTVAQFHSFVAETNYKTDAERNGGCWVTIEQRKTLRSDVDWRYDNKANVRSRDTWDHPVVFVSWYDATAFCQWLSAKTGRRFHLPTAVEWEYAARGGNKTRGCVYSGSNTIDSVAWFGYYDTNRLVGNSGFETHPVGGKKPNELGIYDMSGNVWEWCVDLQPTDSCQIIRGGCWDNYARRCLVVSDMGYMPLERNPGVGFRVAETIPLHPPVSLQDN